MSDLSFLAPEIHQRYADLREIGRGGMGVVLEARDRELDRQVAIKVLHAADFGGGKTRLRFLEEARICSQLTHPNLVRLYAFDAPRERYPPYMIFEFIEGPSLAEFLEARRWTAWKALDIIEGIGRGLDAAHRAGVVHRDLKPENVLLEGGETPKVADFGLAKEQGSSSGVRTRAGILLGTPLYMCPEYIRGETCGPAADLYALGVIAFRLLVGKLPYEHEESVELLRMHVKAPVPDPRRENPLIADELGKVMMRTLAKTPAERYASMEAFLKALARARTAQEEYGNCSPHAMRRRTGAAGTGRNQDTAIRFRVPAPRETDGFPRRRAGALAAAAVLGALGLGGMQLYRSWEATAEELQVWRSPRGLVATWRGSGESILTVEPLPEGAEITLPAPDREGDRFREEVDGLVPGQGYLLRIRSDWTGSVLQSRQLTLPVAGSPARIVPRVEATGRKVSLRVEAEHDVALRWRAEGRRDGEWREIASGGSLDAYASGREVPLPGVFPFRPLRLWTTLRAAGEEEPGEENLLLNGESIFLAVTRAALAGLDQEGLGRALGELGDATMERYKQRSEYPPDPVRFLVRHGADPILEEVVPLLPAYFSSPEIDHEEKGATETLLLPLAFGDAILAGSQFHPVSQLHECRQRWLPDGVYSTLTEGELLGEGWQAPKPGARRQPRYLFPSEYERQVIGRRDKFRQGGGFIRAFAGDLEGDLKAFDDFVANGRAVTLALHLPRALRAGEAVELELESHGFVRRFFLLLTINGKGPYALWSQEADQGTWDYEPTSSFHRIPSEIVQGGLNHLVIRITDLPGRDGFPNPLKVYAARIRVGAP